VFKPGVDGLEDTSLVGKRRANLEMVLHKLGTVGRCWAAYRDQGLEDDRGRNWVEPSDGCQRDLVFLKGDHGKSRWNLI